jgi:hypothetical protein
MREYNYRISEGLSTGLRRTSKNRRGVQALVQATGAFPYDGSLNALPELTEVDISSIDPPPAFPFPQIFVLKRLTVVCTATQIYTRADDGTLSLAIGSLTEGIRWSCADFHYFLVFANGKQLVFRGGEDKAWTTSNSYSLPNGTSVLNYKGQLIITAPGETIPIEYIPAPYYDFSQPAHSMYL